MMESESLAEFFLCHGKLRAFVLVAAFVFVVSVGVFVVLVSPFVVLNVISIEQAAAGALGCGVGTAAVNGTVCALLA